MEGLASIPSSLKSDFMNVEMKMLPLLLMTLCGIPLSGTMCFRYSMASSSKLISFFVAQSTICLEVMQFTLMIASIPSSDVGSSMMKLIDTSSQGLRGGLWR